MVTNVLVCHRNGLVADALRSYLTEQGFCVDLASSIDELLAHVHDAGVCLVEMEMAVPRLGIRRIAAMPTAPRVLALVSPRAADRGRLRRGRRCVCRLG